MGKSTGLSLKVKFFIITMLMCVLLGALIIFVSYRLYSDQINERYTHQGAALVEATSEVVDWDSVDRYFETLQEDQEYWDTLERMRLCVAASDAEYLFVLKPYGEEGCVYIFDTDESEDGCELGYYMDWYDNFGEYASELMRGDSIEPIVTNEEFGWLMSVYIPYTNSEGEFVAYLGVDYSVEHLINEAWAFIGQLTAVTLLVALLMALLFLALFRVFLLRPVKKMTQATTTYLDESNNEEPSKNSIASLDIKTHDELQSLSESLKVMEQRLQNYLAHLKKATVRAETDSMTGLLNREAFEQRVNEFLKDRTFKGSYAFMMIDLDNFKTVNDTYGHVVGDKAIVQCAENLKATLLPGDIVARMGGDEFAVFFRCKGTTEQAESRATDFYNEIKTVEMEGTEPITLSVGVALFDNVTPRTYQNIYVLADNILYDVKNAGRNNYVIKDYTRSL